MPHPVCTYTRTEVFLSIRRLLLLADIRRKRRYKLIFVAVFYPYRTTNHDLTNSVPLRIRAPISLIVGNITCLYFVLVLPITQTRLPYHNFTRVITLAIVSPYLHPPLKPRGSKVENNLEIYFSNYKNFKIDVYIVFLRKRKF